MPIFKFTKLVRDKIVENQIAAGVTPTFRKLNIVEHKAELVNKIIEEAREIPEANPDEIAGEIADVQQALDDLKEMYGISTDEVAQAQERKNEKSGPFKRGHYIEHIEMDESNKWITYYRSNPERYPEDKV